MHVAILGIGEVGSALAGDLIEAGVRVTGWDPTPRNLPDGLHFADNNPDAAQDADLVLSANLAAVAVDVAREVLPCLVEGQVYADLNTGSPMMKREIATLFEGHAALFADVAILAPIAPKRLRSPLLASGNGAAPFAALLAPFNTSITVLDEPAGQAATLKLVRSIFYKGMAAVVIEMVEAAEKLNLTDYAREQMMTILRDEDMIDLFVEGSVVHARRRIHEMDAVIELLNEVGVESFTSYAARQRLQTLLEGKPNHEQ